MNFSIQMAAAIICMCAFIQPSVASAYYGGYSGIKILQTYLNCFENPCYVEYGYSKCQVLKWV